MGTLVHAILLGSLLSGCTITPEEIEKIEAENELLREEIHVMRQNCEYYRDLELQVDEEEPESR